MYLSADYLTRSVAFKQITMFLIPRKRTKFADWSVRSELPDRLVLEFFLSNFLQTDGTDGCDLIAPNL